jgi:hypothetical protein
VAEARERERERKREIKRERQTEREREAANIDLDKHCSSFSQHPQCLFSTFSLPCGVGYTDLYPSLCCSFHTTLAYYAIQIYEAYHLITREFVIYTGDKVVLRIFRPMDT